MEQNGKQFKQFLQSREFSVLVEHIVNICTQTLVKKIEDLEDQLKNYVNLNQTLVTNFSRNKYASLSENASKIQNDSSHYIADAITEENVNLVEEYTEEVNEGIVSNTPVCKDEDNTDNITNVLNLENVENFSTRLSSRSSETSSACSSVKKLSKNVDKTENVLFDKDIFIKHVHLPKKDYNKSMVLGIYSNSFNSDKVVFESQGKRYWIHLDNCKPRSRSEKTVITRLEETLRGNE